MCQQLSTGFAGLSSLRGAIVVCLYTGLALALLVLLVLLTPFHAHAQSQGSGCYALWQTQNLPLKARGAELVCRVRAPRANTLAVLRRNGKFSTLKTSRGFAAAIRQTRKLRTPQGQRKLIKIFRKRQKECRLLGIQSMHTAEAAARFVLSSECDVPPPADPTTSPTATPVATFTPTLTPTPTPTATPPFGGSNRVATSTQSYNFGSIGLSETRFFSFVVKPNQGSPTVLGVDTLSANGISILSAAAASDRGHVPCAGVIDRYCVVVVQVHGNSLGAKSASFSIRVADVSNPQQVDVVGPFTASAHIQASPVVLDNAFTTVSLKAKAQQAGVTPLQHLIDEYNRIKPTSFRVDTTDINSPAVSDALTFDRYGNPWDTVDWRNNWINSVVDFSASSWDSHGGSAPGFHGPHSQGGAAITRCHIATAKHYPRGGGFIFHKRTGEANWFPIQAEAVTPSFDIRVYRIAPCLPADFPVYALLDPNDFSSGLNLVGAPYFGNHYSVMDYIRRASILQIAYISDLPSDSGIWGGPTTLSPASMQAPAQLGDSGSPTFIYFDGRLVLMSTYTYGGWGRGPFYGHAAVQQELQAAIDQTMPGPD